ncbi:ead/Ea22-like family protein [Enterobacter sp. WCHEn045836]|uniref:ead/Ea22-like family protein n=1 Tax=Enterobacter sp. WCHEn045836 TaxID=2497434 RepID=UPI000F828218|nr:ead/Ea22-like family protein [Enterobacter sp. WCHEn045836]RTP98371.1 ead/Ea22-like family protein [Enterobacter sp. WCHEn045836]
MSNIDKQALRNRYSEKPAPKCHICGSVMTIQRAGAGGVVYGCTGRIDKDGEGYKFADGRDFADDHYARSRVTVADESDPDVLALLDELEDKNREISVWRKRCENAEKGSDLLQRRNAELSSAVIAPGVMRCAGCGFVLTKNNISMSAGTITAGDSKTEPCPNGCGPLWPVTWKELAVQFREDSEQWLEELQSARKQIK